MKRWLYVGPTGSISGQYGVFGSIVAVARDAGGGVVVRRSQVFQESFAKYAYFTDIEPSTISFGGGDQIFGPVHTNDDIKIYSSGATFHDETRTHGIVRDPSYGVFKKGYIEHAPRIDMPETAELTKLEAQATVGNTAFYAGIPSRDGEAYLRIEFMAFDLDSDGSRTGENEGFFRVYRSSNSRWVSADIDPSVGFDDSENCGHYETSGTFKSAKAHPNPNTSDDWRDALTSSRRRCYLGGADSLWGSFQASDAHGSYVPWPGAIPAAVATRADAQYLFPLSRAYNPSFKGVIYVEGNVLISGELRGRVTLAATNQIIIGDDITYASSPALGTCADILGIFSGVDVVVADNTINTPQSADGTYRTYDDTQRRVHRRDRARAQQLHGRELRCRRLLRRALPDHAPRPRLPLPHGRHHPGHARRGRHRRRIRLRGRLCEALRLRQVRRHGAPALLPDHRPLREGPDLHGGSGRVQHRRLLRDAHLLLSVGEIGRR